jgi:pimeloyl-ACP methyl ester carboxylesterase
MLINKKSSLLYFCYLLLNTTMAQLPPVNYDNNAAAGHYYTIRGFRMYAEIYGTGVSVLMIPGNGGNLSAFTQNIAYFSKRYRVIAADSRAQGKSSDDADSLSFEQMADDYSALMDELQIKKVNVIGWSDGGIIALLLAIRHPDKVLRLASSGANLWPDSSAILPSVWKEDHTYFETNKYVHWKTLQEKNKWKIFLLDWLQPNISLSALRAIHCPSLIISGDRDLIVLQHTVSIYDHIADASLWILPHCGHATLREHPDEFNKTVDAFFNGPIDQK